MKKRILLSLVSFFMMTAMWASLVEAYRIEVTAANAKTNATAELTLTMKNRNAIAEWQTVLVLPEGVTFVSVAPDGGRYPEGYNANITATDNGDGTVAIHCEGEEGLALTGTDGVVATVTVKIAGTVEPGDYKVIAKDTKLTELGGVAIHNNPNEYEVTWTIEQGEVGVTGDLNGDGSVDIADAVTILGLMASGEQNPAADVNGDGVVDVADFVSILKIMAEQ
jgi:biopolymer transport protein ExbD